MQNEYGYRLEWTSRDNEIHGQHWPIVGVALGRDAHEHARLMAAAPAMFNALALVARHLELRGQEGLLPYNIWWDIRCALANAGASPAATAPAASAPALDLAGA